jgi:hypothetical protein
MLAMHGMNKDFATGLMLWWMRKRNIRSYFRSTFLLSHSLAINLEQASFYVHLPESPPTHLIPRTFIVKPKRTSREWKHFSAAKNKRAPDEIQGHTSMFNGTANDGYYNLGLDTAKVIQQAIHVARGDTMTDKIPSSATDT